MKSARVGRGAAARSPVNCDSTPNGLLKRISEATLSSPRGCRARDTLSLGAAREMELPATIAAIVPQRCARTASGFERFGDRGEACLSLANAQPRPHGA